MSLKKTPGIEDWAHESSPSLTTRKNAPHNASQPYVEMQWDSTVDSSSRKQIEDCCRLKFVDFSLFVFCAQRFVFTSFFSQTQW
jgi:hypothetical protein